MKGHTELLKMTRLPVHTEAADPQHQPSYCLFKQAYAVFLQNRSTFPYHRLNNSTASSQRCKCLSCCHAAAAAAAAQGASQTTSSISQFCSMSSWLCCACCQAAVGPHHISRRLIEMILPLLSLLPWASFLQASQQPARSDLDAHSLM